MRDSLRSSGFQNTPQLVKRALIAHGIIVVWTQQRRPHVVVSTPEKRCVTAGRPTQDAQAGYQSRRLSDVDKPNRHRKADVVLAPPASTWLQVLPIHSGPTAANDFRDPSAGRTGPPAGPKAGARLNDGGPAIFRARNTARPISWQKRSTVTWRRWTNDGRGPTVQSCSIRGTHVERASDDEKEKRSVNKCRKKKKKKDRKYNRVNKRATHPPPSYPIIG